MKEDKDPSFEPEDSTLLVERFEKMMANDERYFYDVEEFEEIMDHYIDYGKINKALKVLEVAKSQHPNTVEFVLREAELFSMSNKPRKALELLQTVEAIEQHNADFHLTKATILSQLGDYEASIHHLKTAAGLTTAGLDSIYLSLAFEYQNLDRNKLAIKYLKLALESNANNEDALYELAYCYDQIDAHEDSLNFYRSFIDSHPYSHHAWYNLGNAYCRLELLEKGIEAYDYAIAIKDDFASAYFNKANTLAKIKRYAEAIVVYKETIQYEFADALTYYYIGECYEKLEDYNNAHIFYHKAIRRDTYLSDAWLGIGIVLDYQNRTGEGIHYVKKAIELDKENADYWYIKGEMEQKLGFIEEAKQAYDRVIAYGYDEHDIWLDYSNLYFELGQFNEAINLLEEGIRQYPEINELYYRIVACLLSLRMEFSALEVMKKALDLQSDNYHLLFEYYPTSVKNSSILDLIESYNNN